MKVIFILSEILAQNNIHIYWYVGYFAWLKYFTHPLVPVLAPKYNQRILSLAKVRKVYYSLADLYVKPFYFYLIVCRGREDLETLQGGGELKWLGTPAV
jgi:hypothetical protein